MALRQDRSWYDPHSAEDRAEWGAGTRRPNDWRRARGTRQSGVAKWPNWGGTSGGLKPPLCANSPAWHPRVSQVAWHLSPKTRRLARAPAGGSPFPARVKPSWPRTCMPTWLTPAPRHTPLGAPPPTEAPPRPRPRVVSSPPRPHGSVCSSVLGTGTSVEASPVRGSPRATAGQTRPECRGRLGVQST